MNNVDDLRLRLVQATAGPDPAENLKRLGERLAKLPHRPALTVLPENTLVAGRAETIRAAADTVAGWRKRLTPLAKLADAPLVIGGVPIRDGRDGIRQCALVLAADGTLLARYDKRHLFQLRPGKPNGTDETALYRPGRTGPVAFAWNGWRIGIAICFDLRFPEFFRALTPPADIWLCPAAFARETGRAHWELLLRARAVENQCYVAAAGLCGTDVETGFVCYGHSLVADPWGAVTAEAEPADREAVLETVLAKARLADVRRQLPALAARRD